MYRTSIFLSPATPLSPNELISSAISRFIIIRSATRYLCPSRLTPRLPEASPSFRGFSRELVSRSSLFLVLKFQVIKIWREMRVEGRVEEFIPAPSLRNSFIHSFFFFPVFFPFSNRIYVFHFIFGINRLTLQFVIRRKIFPTSL